MPRILSEQIKQATLIVDEIVDPFQTPERLALFNEDGTPFNLAAIGAPGPEGPEGPQGPKGDTGDTGPAGASGSSGSVATATLWDTKGDLAVATGADAAAKLPVGSNNQVLTADSSQSTGVKWATPVDSSGGSKKLFEQILAVDTLTLDTGAGGIPAGYGVLDVFIYGRTDEATQSTECYVRLNGDAATNYDWQRISASAASVVGSNVAADNGWDGFLAAANAAANVFGMFHLIIPAYDSTVGFKAGRWTDGYADVAGSSGRIALKTGLWRSTAAINRLSIQAAFSGAVKFKAGSRMLIYGRG